MTLCYSEGNIDLINIKFCYEIIRRKAFWCYKPALDRYQSFMKFWTSVTCPLYAGTLGDKIVADKLMNIPNVDTQNYPSCRFKLVVETFGHSTQRTKQSK